MKNSIPIAVIIAGVLIAGAVIYVNPSILSGQEKLETENETQNVLSSQEAADKALSFINENILEQGMSASLIEAIEENGLYKLKLKIGEQELDLYVTKNGKFLFPQVVDLEQPIVQNTDGEEMPSSVENPVSPEEMEKFITCLKDADFVIYGANWCGWTQKLVEMLGGFDITKPIYIECVEEEEICQEKGISGYPTIHINGEAYGGARTFEDFSAATGCEAPAGAELLEENSGEGGCK